MFDERSFLEQALTGQVSMEDIDDFVDRWHDGQGHGELHEFLGMTREEYGLWMRDPDMLAVICTAHRLGQPLLEAVNDNFEQVRMAARSGDSDKLQTLQAWLRQQGRSV